jgi:hypothetical protein
MSAKDISNTEDGEFDALLQGTGALAELLRAIPQPQPPAGLDAAILARAESMLARDPTPLESAANDARLPESTKPSRSFIRRWKLPLGLAASVLLALPVALTLWRGTTKDESSAMVAAAPPAAPAASPAIDAAAPTAAGSPPLAENVPRVADTKRSGKPADRTLLAQAETATAADAPRPARQQLATTAKDKSSVGEQALFESRKTAPAILAEAGTASKAEAVASGAASPAPQPFPAAVLADANQATQAAALDARTSTSGRTDAGDAAPAVGAALKSKADRSETASNEFRLAGKERPAGTIATPAAVPPAMTTRGNAAGSIAAPAASADAPVAHPSPEKPKAWLTQIEKMLKADKRKQALEEWTKFRKEYPDYPVPKPLLDQITELKQ